MSVRPSSSVPISVVIIAKNEARRIGDCIDSVRNLTDDIVVIDSGSTDRTCEIAAEKGARVYFHRWEGFSQQKNFGNGAARHDWILSLDADERVSPKLAESIQNEFAAKPSYDAYTFHFRSYFEGKPINFGAWGHDYHTRLFDRRKFSWNSDDVHEGLCASSPTRTGRLGGLILHFTIEHRSQLTAKNEFYTSLFADKARRSGKRVSRHKAWFNPPWRFFRDYVVRLGILDGSAGWVIAREGMRYTHLKYSKIAQATGGYRQPNWLGLSGATAALVLCCLGFAHNYKTAPKNMAAPFEQASTQLASDDNYEDGGMILPVDDDGVA